MTQSTNNMKRFDNAKDLREYLENEAKKGETVILDERASMTTPKRKRLFTKRTQSKPKEKNGTKD